ncbi:SCO family protein [Algoriphagus aquimarinus]|uniref:Protein SCO1/2 n=1 Tax=Algoriphagus aquimarinus TaxID=237018 RepID=A0A1I0VZZ9_9BACT|nr:SCO family protein [Algoriphagus aquimarinus]SFA81778.1 protein SCO1/2 [Algoriphagus aquimarinus]
MKSYSLPLILLISILAFSCTGKGAGAENREDEITALPYFNSADFTPSWEKGSHRIPDFAFTNQNGEEITEESYRGKIYVADFFFTICPGICPKLTANMESLQEAYLSDEEVMFLSHSVMPWNDSVPVLKEYAIEHQVNDAKWNLVTGDVEAIYSIAREGYFADEDFTKTLDTSNFIHTENFVLVDGQGFIRGVYNGTLEMDLERLKRHIEILKKEV